MVRRRSCYSKLSTRFCTCKPRAQRLKLRLAVGKLSMQGGLVLRLQQCIPAVACQLCSCRVELLSCAGQLQAQRVSLCFDSLEQRLVGGGTLRRSRWRAGVGRRDGWSLACRRATGPDVSVFTYRSAWCSLAAKGGGETGGGLRRGSLAVSVARRRNV